MWPTLWHRNHGHINYAERFHQPLQNGQNPNLPYVAKDFGFDEELFKYRRGKLEQTDRAALGFWLTATPSGPVTLDQTGDFVCRFQCFTNLRISRLRVRQRRDLFKLPFGKLPLCRERLESPICPRRWSYARTLCISWRQIVNWRTVRYRWR